MADFFVALANNVFAVADGGEVIAEAFADLGKGAGAGISEGSALGAEFVDLVVGEIDLVLELKVLLLPGLKTSGVACAV